ncbi:MAG: aminotransferase class I/II-fold pyridoxal phosphate-dependent enzyme [Cyanobium sp.]
MGEALAALPAERRRGLRPLEPCEAPAELRIAPQAPPLLDLASNDYLGLSRHPELLAAAAAELQRSGLGAGASRLISGSRPVHQQLESELAAWLGRERVLLFPSGFQANLGAVTCLADRHSLVLADRLIHHSLLVGVQASGARLRRFRHNDASDLERLLVTARREAPERLLLVLVESLYSMEGTSPDLHRQAELCRDHGALLLVDEAHALGVLGTGGRGLSHGLPAALREHTLVSGTFGKAFGSGGAFLAGDALLGEWLLQRCGAFRYSTALAPPLAAGALAALHWLQAQEHSELEMTDQKGAAPELSASRGRGGASAAAPVPLSPAAALLARARRWREALAAAGWPRPPGEGPVLPLLVGDDAAALALQQRLEQAGLLTVAIRPPTVPAGSARLRLVLRQDLPGGTLERLLAALGPGPGPGPAARRPGLCFGVAAAATAPSREASSP